MKGDLLLYGDPLLEAVRKQAQTDPDAHEWLLDSARTWAVGEFIRREERREDAEHKRGFALDSSSYVDERLDLLRLHQVALHAGFKRAARATTETVQVGFLLADSTTSYLRLQVAHGAVRAGVYTVLDVFELPPEYRVGRWPYDRPTSVTGAESPISSGRSVEDIMELAHDAQGDLVVTRTEYDRVKKHIVRDYGQYGARVRDGGGVTLFGTPLVVQDAKVVLDIEGGVPQPKMNT